MDLHIKCEAMHMLVCYSISDKLGGRSDSIVVGSPCNVMANILDCSKQIQIPVLLLHSLVDKGMNFVIPHVLD